MIRKLFRSAARGLTRNMAMTSPSAEDARLRGRTYAIPFDEVWRDSLELVGGALRGWEIVEADDREGVIRGVAHSRIQRLTSAITIRISLDADAQTRVDGLATSRVARADLGTNARRLRRFFAALDERLADRRGAGIEAFCVDPAPETAHTP